MTTILTCFTILGFWTACAALGWVAGMAIAHVENKLKGK